MPKKLVNLSVHEISLVDQGANQHAHISFFKNRNKGSQNMTPKELEEKLTKSEAEVKKLTDENVDLKKKLEDKEADVKKSATEVEKKLTDVTKERDDAKTEVTKRDEEIAKLKSSNEEKDLIAEVNKRFPLTAGKPEEKAQVLKAVKAMPEEQQKVVLKAMEDAEARLAELAKEKGTTGGGKGDASEPEAKLEALSKKLQTESAGKLTYEQAYSKAVDTEEGRELNKQIRASKK